MLVEKVMNFCFCSDIYSASRFIDNEHFRVKQKPFRENNLLLIAATQTLDGLR